MVRKSNQQPSAAEELADKYQPLSIKTAMSTGDAEAESLVRDKYAVTIQPRRARIEYLAFGEDTIVESKRCTSSDDEAALKDARHDTETRRCDAEEKRSGPGNRTLSDDDSQFSIFLNKDFSSDDDMRDFAISRVSNEQTSRSLICDFQREDFALQISESSMDSESSESFEEMILTDSQGAGVNAAEIDRVVDFHSGLRLSKVKKENVPIEVAHGEEIQQAVANSSLEKPLAGMSLERTAWEMEVNEAIYRERAAMKRRGECSVDAVVGVVNDLCLMGGIDEVSQKTVSVDVDYKMGAEQNLHGLKTVLTKRPLSPLAPCSQKQSTRKSDLSAALSDLCFMGEPKKLERSESTLLLETAVRGLEKTSAETRKCDVERDHPFDEQESLIFNLIRMINEVLAKSGNSFMSNDLVDLSGNVSLVPVSSTLTFRHPVMAAVALEENHFPAFGDWQLGEIEEIVKDVRVWMERKATASNPASDSEANSDKQMPEASQKRNLSLKTEVNGNENSSGEAMKHALHSPRRSYSKHKLSRNLETTDYVCGLCVSRSGMVAGKDDSLLGLIRLQGSKLTEPNEAVSVPYDEAYEYGDKNDNLKEDIASDEMSPALVKFEVGIFSFSEVKVHEIKYKVARTLSTIQNGKEGSVVVLKEYFMFVPFLEAYIAANNDKDSTSKRSYFNACQFELSFEAIKHVKAWVLGLLMTKGCVNTTPFPNVGMLTEDSSSLTAEARVSLPETNEGHSYGTSLVQGNTSTGQNKALAQVLPKTELQEAPDQTKTVVGAAHNAKDSTSERSYFNACQFELSLEALKHVKAWLLGLLMTKCRVSTTPFPNAGLLTEDSSCSLTAEARVSLPETHKGRSYGTSIVQGNTSTDQDKALAQLLPKTELQEAPNQTDDTLGGAHVLEIDGALNANVEEMVTDDGLVGCDGFEVDGLGVVSPTGPVEVASSPCSKNENIVEATSNIAERFCEFTSCGRRMDAVEDLLFDETVKDLPSDECLRDDEREMLREVSSDETTKTPEAVKENRSSDEISASVDAEQIDRFSQVQLESLDFAIETSRK